MTERGHGGRGKEVQPKLEDLIHMLWHAPERGEWTPKVEVICLDDLRRWMQHQDIEVLGFVQNIIHGCKFHIEPPLPRQEYVSFKKHYLERCFKENPSGDWSDSRYSAGSVLIGLIVDLWQADGDQRIFADIKGWLTKLYKNGDQELRTCIENATLEHLPPKILRKFLSDWKHDPELRSAYDLFFPRRQPSTN